MKCLVFRFEIGWQILLHLFIYLSAYYLPLIRVNYNCMQEDQHRRETYNARRRVDFCPSKNVQEWDDFKNTWRNIKFSYQLNHMTLQQIHSFWQKELDHLLKDDEKFTILVPSSVDSVDSQKATDHQTKNQKPIEEKIEKKSKKQGKETKKDEVKKEKLLEKVIETAIKLLTEDENYKEKLNFEYQSLYLGNDKQLLIYRKCTTMERYLEKYRLPNVHQKKIEELERHCSKLFNLVKEKNMAISTFDSEKIESFQESSLEIQKEFEKAFDKFEDYLQKIFDDFKQKKQSKEIHLNTMRQQIVSKIQKVCVKHELYLKPKYIHCEQDEFKDIIIQKEKIQNYFQIEDLEENDEEEIKQVEYIYVEPEREMEAPKQVEFYKFSHLDFQKQCFVYEFHLPSSGKYNKMEGLFIRSPEEEDTFECNIDIVDCNMRRSINVQIFPYKKGWQRYQIYSWNQIGFTKCLEKIQFYNEFKIFKLNYSGQMKNSKLFLLGKSNEGIIEEKKSTNEEFEEQRYTCKDFSLGNSLILCNKEGQVAGWGQMYCFEDNQESEETEDSHDIIQLKDATMRIESPCLLLEKEHIRQISCGFGYSLMTDRFGKVWSMGINHFGHLGLSHFVNNEDNLSPQAIRNYSETPNPFIVEVKASYFGGSLALSNKGELYRWGANQVESTHNEIKNSFGDVINYSPHGVIYKTSTPFKANKRYVNGKIIAIETGNGFYFALNSEGILFGWGLCKNLGLGTLLDINQDEVKQIVNPIQIMREVSSVTAGLNHCLVIKKDNKILGWGDCEYFSNVLKKFSEKPIDLTDEYGSYASIHEIKAGYNFVVIAYKDQTIKVFGQKHTFQKQSYQFAPAITKIQCGENIFGLLTS